MFKWLIIPWHWLLVPGFWTQPLGQLHLYDPRVFSHVAGSMQTMGFKHSFTSANIFKLKSKKSQLKLKYCTLTPTAPPPALFIIGPSTPVNKPWSHCYEDEEEKWIINSWATFTLVLCPCFFIITVGTFAVVWVPVIFAGRQRGAQIGRNLAFVHFANNKQIIHLSLNDKYDRVEENVPKLSRGV